MTTALFLLAMAVLAAYVCRMDSLDRRRDPLWYMVLTYAMFLLTVDAAEDLVTVAGEKTFVFLFVSTAWITWTYFYPVRPRLEHSVASDQPQ